MVYKKYSIRVLKEMKQMTSKEMDVPSTQTKENNSTDFDSQELEVFDNLVNITKKANGSTKWFSLPLGITIKNTDENQDNIQAYNDLYNKVVSKLGIEGLSGKDKLTKVLIYVLKH